MRLIAIGDPHGDLEKIRKIPLEGADLILLTGDLGSADLIRKRHFEDMERRKKGLPTREFSLGEEKAAYMETYNSTIRILKYLSKFAPVYTIFGNADFSYRDVRGGSNKLGLKLPSLQKETTFFGNFKIMNDKLLKIKGQKIGCLEYFIDVSWVKDFRPHDFEKRLESAKKETEKAKKALEKFGKVDILLCHQPPLGILDKVNNNFVPKDWLGKHAGSKIILDYIKKQQPKYVFCGHIHEGEGMQKLGKTEIYNLGVAGYKVLDL